MTPKPMGTSWSFKITTPLEAQQKDRFRVFVHWERGSCKGAPHILLEFDLTRMLLECARTLDFYLKFLEIPGISLEFHWNFTGMSLEFHWSLTRISSILEFYLKFLEFH